MSWRINEVDQETIAILLLLDEVHVLLSQFIIQGNSTRGRERERKSQNKIVCALQASIKCTKQKRIKEGERKEA